jgi:transposase
MLLVTILNRAEKYKSFVYKKAEWADKADPGTIYIQVEPRKNGRPICSVCGEAGPGYDRQKEPRYFEFVPLWGMAVFLVYRMRRVDCPRCGVKVEQVPWCDGKNRLTITYRWFLAHWAERMSWKEVSRAFHTSWQSVFRSVKHAVSWGLEHRDLDGVESIGVDEIQWQRGHKYLTLVYQIDKGCRRLLWVGKDRTEETFLRFFRKFGIERTGKLKFICSDMWKPYLKVITQKAPQAINILDRFHIMSSMNKAINRVRIDEVKRLEADGLQPVLKNARWALLKRKESMTEKQVLKMAELVQYNLKSIRSVLMRDDFQRFWQYSYAACAGKFLDQWCTRAMRSKIDPMKKVATTLRNHRDLILNWFEADGKLSSGIVEGFNTKTKLTIRKAYGFRSYTAAKTALYHQLGALPKPEFAHRFW